MESTATLLREGCASWLLQQPAQSAEAKRSLKQPDPECGSELSLSGARQKLDCFPAISGMYHVPRNDGLLCAFLSIKNHQSQITHPFCCQFVPKKGFGTKIETAFAAHKKLNIL